MRVSARLPSLHPYSNRYSNLQHLLSHSNHVTQTVIPMEWTQPLKPRVMGVRHPQGFQLFGSEIYNGLQHDGDSLKHV